MICDYFPNSDRTINGAHFHTKFQVNPSEGHNSFYNDNFFGRNNIYKSICTHSHVHIHYYIFAVEKVNQE